ncbi:MAG: ribbon-helix-helix domain-containing protein [Sulfurisoma sp.]|nr:ribbon-helix-helix domain-containing protein [Sulfurisoma sp.]
MRTTRQFSITLPNEMAGRVKSMVATGAYATESEVFRDGLRALMAREKSALAGRRFLTARRVQLKVLVKHSLRSA